MPPSPHTASAAFAEGILHTTLLAVGWRNNTCDPCAFHEGELWCANAFYLSSLMRKTSHCICQRMIKPASNVRAYVAGTVNGQPKTAQSAACSLKGNSPFGELPPRAAPLPSPVALCAETTDEIANSPTTRCCKTALPRDLTRPAGVAPAVVFFLAGRQACGCLPADLIAFYHRS